MDDEGVSREIARRIRIILDKNGMSRSGLAYQAGIPSSTVYSLFNGKSKNISINTLWCICEYGFEIPISRLFSDDWESIKIPKHTIGLSGLLKKN